MNNFSLLICAVFEELIKVTEIVTKNNNYMMLLIITYNSESEGGAEVILSFKLSISLKILTGSLTISIAEGVRDSGALFWGSS